MKRFLPMTLLAILCITILTVSAAAAPAGHPAAKSAQPSESVQDNVYLITSSSSITALNASTGAFLWQFQPGAYVDPPHVANNIVYTLVLSPGTTTLYALNETTGATRWKFQPSNGSPNVPVISNAVYVTVDSTTSNSSTLYALNASTGTTLWSFQPGTSLFTPVISGNIVYIGTVYSTSIYALTASKGKLLWHSQPSAFSFSIGPVANGIIYGSSEGSRNTFGILYAFSTHNGAFLWSFKGGLWAESHATSYVEGGTTANPTICALNNSNGSQRWCTPGFAVTLAGGLVYVTTGQSAFQVYKDSNGSLLWSSTNARFLTVDQGVVYAVDNNNAIEALKASNGSPLWRSQTAYGVSTYFFVVNGRQLIIASADNLSVYALKAKGGALQWRYHLPGALFSVSISRGVVYVTTLNGTIYALKASDGTLMWMH